MIHQIIVYLRVSVFSKYYHFHQWKNVIVFLLKFLVLKLFSKRSYLVEIVVDMVGNNQKSLFG